MAALAAAPLIIAEGAALAAVAPLLAGGAMMGFVAFKAVTLWKAASAAAAAVKAAAAAEAAALAKAAAAKAAEVAMTAAAEGAATAAMEIAAPVLLWPWAVGAVAVVAAIGGVYYYYPTKKTTPDRRPTRKKTPKGGEKPSGPDRGAGRPPRPPRPPKIPRRHMKRLLEKHGREMWERLRDLSENPDHVGTIWGGDGDIRLDVGDRDVSLGRPNIKNWNFQVNRGATSHWAKWLKRTRRFTHAKLFEGKFDMANMPSLEDWLKGILDSYL